VTSFRCDYATALLALVLVWTARQWSLAGAPARAFVTEGKLDLPDCDLMQQRDRGNSARVWLPNPAPLSATLRHRDQRIRSIRTRHGGTPSVTLRYRHGPVWESPRQAPRVRRQVPDQADEPQAPTRPDAAGQHESGRIDTLADLRRIGIDEISYREEPGPQSGRLNG
jgi:hypothetical protein